MFGVCRPVSHDSSLYLFVLVLFLEAVVLSQVHVAWDIFYQHIVHVYRGVVYNHHLCPVADRGVSGPWGPQFCGALCNGETQRLPAGGAEANAFWQQHIENWLKIRYIGRHLYPQFRSDKRRCSLWKITLSK